VFGRRDLSASSRFAKRGNASLERFNSPYDRSEIVREAGKVRKARHDQSGQNGHLNAHDKSPNGGNDT
jgi:hypothetical protein